HPFPTRRSSDLRFGAVNELGVFAMTDRGLRGVANPSALFLSTHATGVPGSCVNVTQEGTRPLLVEIQALVDTAHVPNPRRLSVGLEHNRLAMLLAVLHRHAGIACYDQDVFVNAVGGVRVSEPAADLSVLLAIVSSLKNRALPRGVAAFGEVGLAGEIRPAPRGQERLREAAKLGFSHVLLPRANAPRRPIEGVEAIALDRVDQARAAAWAAGAGSASPAGPLPRVAAAAHRAARRPLRTAVSSVAGYSSSTQSPASHTPGSVARKASPAMRGRPGVQRIVARFSITVRSACGSGSSSWRATCCAIASPIDSRVQPWRREPALTTTQAMRCGPMHPRSKSHWPHARSPSS